MDTDANPYLDVPAADTAATAVPTNRLRLTGGAALAKAIQVLHDGPLFGMAGFQFATYYEAIRTSGMRHWLINDERSAMFAADAWARVTNRPAVVDATLGPGATNLVSGLVESLNAGIPAVVLVGDAHRLHAGKNMTQEGRQVDILRPAVKELLRVEHVQRIPELVGRAFDLARRGRPGPVVIDVPEDVAHESWDFDPEDFDPEEFDPEEFDPEEFDALARRGKPLKTRASAAQVAAAAEAISAAQRLVLLVGGGVHLSGAYESLARFARSQNIPVAHTLSGKGAIACNDPPVARRLRTLQPGGQRPDHRQ